MAQIAEATDEEIVFEFDQAARLQWNVKWRPKRSWSQVVRDRRSFEIAKGNKGMCMSMVCAWVRKTSQSGGRVDSLAQLGNLQSIAIAHAAFRGDEAKLLDVYDLKGVTLDYGDSDDDAFTQNDIDGAAGWLDPKQDLFLAIYLSTPGRDAGSGHVVGVHAGPTVHRYFDPNYGLYKFATNARLEEVVRECLAGYFNYLNDEKGGGGWSIAHLTAR